MQIGRDCLIGLELETCLSRIGGYRFVTVSSAREPIAGPPSVSVLMAVHNSLPYLEEALRSVMDQTLRDIEIVVVDDASTDATPELLARLASEDPRLRVETLRENHRLPAALNVGLRLCSAPLVARMDADDIAHPERLQVQKHYMDAHPEVALCGTGIRKIDAEGRVSWIEHRDYDAFMVRWIARFNMPLVHPTFMFRNPAPDGTRLTYDQSMPVAQDYDFCIRALAHGKVVCLGELLLDYRVHKGSLTGTKRRDQNSVAAALATRFQEQELPQEIVVSLKPVLAALYGQGAVGRDLFRGLHEMIARDAERAPERRKWMYRKSAELVEYILRTRGGRFLAWKTILTSAPDFFVHLALAKITRRGRRLHNRIAHSAPKFQH